MLAALRATDWNRLYPWLIAALVCFFLGLSVHYGYKAAGHGSAIVRWHNQIKSLEMGEDPYELHGYPNPPIMAILLTPLTWLGPLASAVVWFFLKAGMTLLALHWVFQLIETAGQPFPVWAKVLTVLLSLTPIIGDLEHGNVNLFILFLVVGALYLFHERRDLGAGVVMGLAIACKVTPALFVPYFLWKRAWKAALGCGVGLVLFLWLVPGALLGWDTNRRDLASWADKMVIPYVSQSQVTSKHTNQSLPGLASRLLTHSPSFFTYVGETFTPLEWHNLVALEEKTAQLLVRGCAILFGLLVLWTCRTPISDRHDWRHAAEYGIVILGMLLFSERTWKHHGVTLVVPLGVLCYSLSQCKPRDWRRAYLIGSLTVVVLLMSTASTTVLPGRGAKLAQVYGAYVWAYLVLLAALAVLLQRRSAAAQSRGELSIEAKAAA